MSKFQTNQLLVNRVNIASNFLLDSTNINDALTIRNSTQKFPETVTRILLYNLILSLISFNLIHFLQTRYSLSIWIRPFPHHSIKLCSPLLSKLLLETCCNLRIYPLYSFSTISQAQSTSITQEFKSYMLLFKKKKKFVLQKKIWAQIIYLIEGSLVSSTSSSTFNSYQSKSQLYRLIVTSIPSSLASSRLPWCSFKCGESKP